jgi:hypothetical protein
MALPVKQRVRNPELTMLALKLTTTTTTIEHRAQSKLDLSPIT